MSGMLSSKFGHILATIIPSSSYYANHLILCRGPKAKKDMVRGQRLYVAGDGIGHPKEGMPVRVRLRQK